MEKTYFIPATQEALWLKSPDKIQHVVLEHGDQGVTKILDYRNQSDFKEFQETWKGFECQTRDFREHKRKVLLAIATASSWGSLI